MIYVLPFIISAIQCDNDTVGMGIFGNFETSLTGINARERSDVVGDLHFTNSFFRSLYLQ